MEENQNFNNFGEQNGQANTPPAAYGYPPINTAGQAAPQGTAQYGTYAPNLQNNPYNPNAAVPQRAIPPRPDAVMMMGSDGRYYWVIPTAPQEVNVPPTVSQPIPPTAAPQAFYQNAPQGANSVPVYSQPVFVNGVNPAFYPAPVAPAQPQIPAGYTARTFEERKGIRRQALSIGFAFLCILIVPTVLSLLFTLVFSRVSGGNFYKNFLDSPIYNEILQIAFSTLSFTVPFIIFAKCVGKQNIAEIAGFNRVKRGLALPMFFFGIAFCAFAQMASEFSSEFFGQFFDYQVPSYERAPGIVGLILSLISTAITPALVEEFACRGIVLGSLRKYGDGLAIIASSVLFGIMHGNFDQIPFAFLVGLVLGFIRVKSGSIWICCAVHSFNNLLSVIYDALNEYLLTDTQTGLLFDAVILVCILLGFVALFLADGKEEIFKLEKSTTECTGKQKFKWFFTSPVIIIMMAENILGAIAFFFPSDILSIF